jgi:hypothetical protein
MCEKEYECQTDPQDFLMRISRGSWIFYRETSFWPKNKGLSGRYGGMNTTY